MRFFFYILVNLFKQVEITNTFLLTGCFASAMLGSTKVNQKEKQMETKLGKIQKVHLGIGGYQDAMMGFNFTLGGDGWGVATQWKGHWISDPSEHAKWTKEDRIKILGEAMMDLGKLIQAAKVTDVYQLVGKPIEATFEGMVLKDWRILTEVL